ncbi:MAG: HU family DNA-binding protein [Deltaproteobacteria bacterium]|nr:HU family DNA-binding protein [Deltaproteobacteria bacterium]
MAKKPAKKSAKKAAKPKKAAAKKASKMSAKAAKPAPVTVPKTRTASRPKNSSTLSYTQSEFLENIKGFCGLVKRSQAKELCEDIALFVKDSLKRGYKIPLFGLGKMYVRQTKPRMGRNPATGEVMPIPAKKRVRFSVAKALKEAVLK